VVELCNQFEWPHGPKKVIAREQVRVAPSPPLSFLPPRTRGIGHCEAYWAYVTVAFTGVVQPHTVAPLSLCHSVSLCWGVGDCSTLAW
jgi:hypothetical protein